jgi:hypothetical protein
MMRLVIDPLGHVGHEILAFRVSNVSPTLSPYGGRSPLREQAYSETPETRNTFPTISSDIGCGGGPRTKRASQLSAAIYVPQSKLGPPHLSLA